MALKTKHPASGSPAFDEGVRAANRRVILHGANAAHKNTADPHVEELSVPETVYDGVDSKPMSLKDTEAGTGKG